MFKYLKFLALMVVLVAGLLLAFIYSGLTNVSATAKDGYATRWVLGTIRERSIESRLDTVHVPVLDDPDKIRSGAEHYHEMCEGCHLAPGLQSSELRAGLNPRPPVLAHAVPYSNPAELFWIIKNGIKMTGMPAWGVTHDDQKIWNIVAFLQQLPRLTPAEYHDMIRTGKQVDSVENMQEHNSHIR